MLTDMKHLEPLPKKPNEAQFSINERGKKRSKFYAWFLVAVFVGGLGYGITNFWSPLPADHVSEAEKAELVKKFTQISTVEVKKVDKYEVGATLDSMRLDPDSRTKLLKTLDLDDGKTAQPTVLAQVTLWDFAAEDGDIVKVSSAGYEIDVRLLKTPVVVAVPVDESKTVQLTGLIDGGGGITLGIMNGTGAASLPVMRQGQVLNIPVSF